MSFRNTLFLKLTRWAQWEDLPDTLGHEVLLIMIIGILNQKSGAGKTTISANLARSLQQDGKGEPQDNDHTPGNK